MLRKSRQVRTAHPMQRRSGMTTPAVAVALLVIMMGLALIIDRTYLETAKLELRTAAEAAALAAAGELACDDLLQPNISVELRLNNARQTAGWIASQNYVCGSPVTLDVEPEKDIRIGQLVQDPKGLKFEESTVNPTTVVVTALRTRANNNPVALFISGASGLAFADVAARAEATIDNDVIGLRPFEGSAIPALPIAIWKVDRAGKRSDTWEGTIESNQGADGYAFDEESHTVITASDGIPELVLHSLRMGGDTTDPNVQLLDLETGFVDLEVNRQFEKGISTEDLKTLDGEIRVGQGAKMELTSTPDLTESQSVDFQKMIGERRICFLYSSAAPQHTSPLATTTCTDIVVIRIMAVKPHSDGSSDVTIQPAIMTTRTAILASEILSANNDSAANYSSDSSGGAATDGNSPNSMPNAVPSRYLYKLRLTH